MFSPPNLKKIKNIWRNSINYYTNFEEVVKTADLKACELVNLLFLLVWVPGKRLISFLGHRLKSCGTTGLRHWAFKMWKKEKRKENAERDKTTHEWMLTVIGNKSKYYVMLPSAGQRCYFYTSTTQHWRIDGLRLYSETAHSNLVHWLYILFGLIAMWLFGNDMLGLSKWSTSLLCGSQPTNASQRTPK